jgi:uncharacterized SAM-binding protein YcdF (DUF218 family)
VSRWGLWSIFAPSQVILACLALAAILLLLGKLRTGRWLAVLGGTLLVIFGVLPTSHYLVHALEVRFPKPELPQRIDGILLLAGSERVAASAVYGEPHLQYNAGRYIATLRLAERHPEAKVVYTGGSKPDPSLGVVDGAMGVARSILLGSGLDARRVAFEGGSGDTCGSPLNAKRLLDPQPDQNWVVVTSAIHMPRTIGCFEAAGWKVIPFPSDYLVILGGFNLGSVQIASNLELLDLAMHEWLGLVYYRLTGRIEDWFPAPAS